MTAIMAPRRGGVKRRGRAVVLGRGSHPQAAAASPVDRSSTRAFQEAAGMQHVKPAGFAKISGPVGNVA